MPEQKPTVGRIVHVEIKHQDGPRPAIITRVWNETTINAAVFNHDGTSEPRTSLVRGDEGPSSWNWPPRN